MEEEDGGWKAMGRAVRWDELQSSGGEEGSTAGLAVLKDRHSTVRHRQEFRSTSAHCTTAC